MVKKIEHLLEVLMFNSRWLLAPFYLGLVGAIVILLVKFGQEFLHVAPHVFSGSEGDIILAILTLVDMSLVANLLLIIIFSGYENFVSKINTAGHEDRPEWMGKVDFSGLKIKLIGSIVAISGIELLKAFVNLSLDNFTKLSPTDTLSPHEHYLAWKVGLHLTFVVSGIMFALMDRIAEGHKHAPAAHGEVKPLPKRASH
jgi:uncharacterized protein (TIGR00645 family)